MCGVAELRDLPPGAHVCWSVDTEASYVDCARELLRAAAARGEKAIVFGPKESRPLIELVACASVVADPLADFLGGRFDADAMLALFDRETTQARSDRYRGIAVVADMDWLLSAATPEQTLAFELRLDRKINELGATVACAYRTSSFDSSVRRSLHSTHPVNIGVDGLPAFRLVAGVDGTWLLSGEVDWADAQPFAQALKAAISSGPCTIDARDLRFIGVSGMRQLARAAKATPQLCISNAPLTLRRGWRLARFAEAAPGLIFYG